MTNVLIDPANIALAAGEARTFKATNDSGAALDVNWRINPAVGGIAPASPPPTSAVTFTAPEGITEPQTVIITATTGADSASATISLTDGSPAPLDESRGTPEMIPAGDPGEVTLKSQLEGVQWAGLILAGIVGAVIVAVTLILLIEWWRSAPSIALSSNFLTIDPKTGTPIVADAAREKAFVENMKFLSDIAVDRSLKLFDDIVGRVLLPVFISILGYIFATKGGNTTSSQNTK